MNNVVQISEFNESQTPPLPRKLPQQCRSRLLFDSIKEACLKILERDGYESLTAIHLADVAGVCVGSIYQYFPNIEAVVAAVYADEVDLVVREMRQRRLALASRMGLEEHFRFMLTEGARLHERMLSLDEEFFKRYVSTYMATNWFNQSMNNEDAAAIEIYKIIKAHEVDCPVDDPWMKAVMIASAHRAIFIDVIKTHPEFLSETSFCDHVMDMTLGILFGARSGDSSEERFESEKVQQ